MDFWQQYTFVCQIKFSCVTVVFDIAILSRSLNKRPDHSFQYFNCIGYIVSDFSLPFYSNYVFSPLSNFLRNVLFYYNHSRSQLLCQQASEKIHFFVKAEVRNYFCVVDFVANSFKVSIYVLTSKLSAFRHEPTIVIINESFQ